MSPVQLQGVIALLFGVVAVSTFLLQGRQWLTFVTAGVFGMFFGSVPWGRGLMSMISSVVSFAIGGLS